MNGGAFCAATQSFKNAAHFKTLVHKVDRYPPIDELAREIRNWFSTIAGEEEDQQLTNVRVRVARLRGTVMFGLLPFDHPALQLTQQLEQISETATYFPSLAGIFDRLETLVGYLIENPDNPKGKAVIEQLRRHALKRSPRVVAIVSPKSRLAVPGWGEELRDELVSVWPKVDIVASRKRFLAGRFDKLILPWGGMGCPFLYELFHAYCSPSIDVIAYSSERCIRPGRRELPKGSWHPRKRSRTSQPQDIEVVESIGDPEWKQIEFWTALRSVTEQAGLEQRDNDREFYLQARLVLLGNETKVFLAEGSKVIEVSDLLEGRQDSPEVSSRFPRKRVGDLRPGDLIVLRTSGSGEYLISVADALMKQDGKADLRERALDWKVALNSALTAHGSKVLADMLAKRGQVFESHHKYIWVWTTMDVIRPRSENLFYELLAILQDLGFLESEALETAESRWAMIREIYRYHQRAGAKIRESLLKKLKKFVKEKRSIDDSIGLTLPGVNAGELSVLRVSAVDPEVIEVPYHRVGIVLGLFD
ncbi:hypothetical protein N9980_00320 [bacterium]|nr:hypothetical protein [bacterium]